MMRPALSSGWKAGRTPRLFCYPIEKDTMAKVIYGERIGRTASLRTGCSAFILDPMGERVLMTRRADNGQWCLPGGAMEAGESLSETCIREVWEETGLVVRIMRLVGVYSTPHRIVTYPDGNQWQIISHNF